MTQKLGRLLGYSKSKASDASGETETRVETISPKVERQATVSQVDVNVGDEEGEDDEEGRFIRSYQRVSFYYASGKYIYQYTHNKLWR